MFGWAVLWVQNSILCFDAWRVGGLELLYLIGSCC